MEEYGKSIPISFVVNDNSAKETEMKIDSVVKGITIDVGSAAKTSVKEMEEVSKTTVDAKASLRELLDAQYAAYENVDELKSMSEADRTSDTTGKNDKNEHAKSDEALKSERAISDELVRQTKELGVDGQLGILKEKEELMRQILDLSELDTKESAEKTKDLQTRLDYLNKTYKIERDNSADERDEKKQLGKSSAICSLQDIDSTLSGGTITKTIGTLSTFKTGLVAGLATTGAAFVASVKNVFDEGAKKAEELLKASRVSNSETRDTMFTWGFDKKTAYGYNQAMSALGFQSEDDLYYADKDEQQLFYSTMSKFADEYAKLEQDGYFKELLANNVEMNQFEQELALKESKFYMENEDSVKEIKEFTLEIKMLLVDALGWLVKGLNAKYTTTDDKKTNDIYQTYSNVSDSSKQTSIKIDNSFNNQAASSQTSVESSLQNMLNAVEAAIS